MERLNPYLYAADIKLLAYENAWVQYIKNNEILENVISEEIYDSWHRCKTSGIDPFSEERPPQVELDELRRRLKANEYILRTAEPFMQILFDMVDTGEFVIIVADKDGIILQTLCDESMSNVCEKTNTRPGGSRSEENAGTNSISLAIQLKKSIQLSGCQHYRRLFHHWACSSSPVCSQNGDILCILAIAGKYELANEHTLGMVHLAAKAIEMQYYIEQINSDVKKRNNQLSTILSMIPDGILYTEDLKIQEANHAILELLEKKAEEVVGHDLYDIIHTQPPLSELLSEQYETTNRHVVLMGSNKSYKCLISYERVKNEVGAPYGKILKFTQLKTIEIMASKIHYTAKYSFSDLIGESQIFKEAISIAKKASNFENRVIITGESGTGKEMFAQAIHNGSSRQNGPFIPVDCGAIPHELFESEFFGYEKGAFTGANKEGKIGIIERADNGTLFLDEIGNLPLEMQVKLLRVLQEGVVFRVGGREPIAIDVRVIAATNVNLKEAVKAGTFREDLYYRLNVFSIQLPPLRSRRSDIPLLVNAIIRNTDTVNASIRVAREAMNILIRYDWPGNVRQLSNAIERAIIMSDGTLIKPEDLSEEILESMEENHGSGYYSSALCGDTLDTAICKYIRFTLDSNHGNVTKTAKQLRVSRSTVYKYLSRSIE